MKKNAKMLPKVNNDGGRKNYESTSVIRRSRQIKRQMYEESTDNHGASHHVKVFVETVTDTVGAIKANVIDADSVLAFIKGKVNIPTNDASSNIEDAEFEEIPESRTGSLALPFNESKTSDNSKELPSKADNGKNDEESTFMIAKKMLGSKEIAIMQEPHINQTYYKHITVSPDGNNIITQEKYEYDKSCLHNDKIDFSLFQNPEKFVSSLDLSKANIKECIVQYVNSRSHSRPKIREQYCMLLSYILKVEKENNLVLMPVVVGNLFWDMFESFLIDNGLAPNTIASICGQLRIVIRWAARFNAQIAIDLDDRRFESKNIKPAIALSEDDISHIYWFDIDSLNFRPQKKRTLKKVRDHFILSCFLGQSYSDSIRVEKDNFKRDGSETFTITQQKTGNTAVLDFNKIFKEYPKFVHDILEKYNYKSPWAGHLSNYNRYLHELARLIGFNETIRVENKQRDVIIEKDYKKWELISSHTARRTFITNAVKRGVHTEYIKKASGHHSDRSFGKYVKL